MGLFKKKGRADIEAWAKALIQVYKKGMPVDRSVLEKEMDQIGCLNQQIKIKNDMLKDLLKVHHGVLLYYLGEEDENADLTIKTKRTGILAIAARNEDGMSKLIESVEGDQELYKAFCDSMASLKLYFNIVEP